MHGVTQTKLPMMFFKAILRWVLSILMQTSNSCFNPVLYWNFEKPPKLERVWGKMFKLLQYLSLTLQRIDLQLCTMEGSFMKILGVLQEYCFAIYCTHFNFQFIVSVFISFFFLVKPLRVKDWEIALLEYCVAMVTDSTSKHPLSERLSEISCPGKKILGYNS